MFRISLLCLLLFLASANASQCPATCSCKKAGVVDCSNKGLSSIPSDIPPTATVINLGLNNIASVPDNAFAKAPNLVTIDLRHNAISSLGDAAFNGLKYLRSLFLISNRLDENSDWTSVNNAPSLTNLYLSHNLFTVLPHIQSKTLSRLVLDGNRIASANFPEVYSVCYNLKSIVLSGNNIAAIASSDFTNIAQLSIKSLDLKQNTLSQIDPTAFQGLAMSLETLNLDHNSLDVAMIKQFLDGLKNTPKLALLTLSLGYNNIKTLDADFLTPLAMGTLRNLQLDGNFLSKVDPKVFDPLAKSLELLSLGNCGLKEVPFNVSNLEKLQDFRINHNRLTTPPGNLPKSLQRFTAAANVITGWSKSVFNQLPHLSGLDLSGNNIANFSDKKDQPNSLSNLINTFQVLNLNANPFNCTCDLAWLVKLAAEKPKVVLNFKKYNCANLPNTLVKDFNISSCKDNFFRSHSVQRQHTQHMSLLVLRETGAEMIALVSLFLMALVSIVAMLTFGRWQRRLATNQSEKQRLIA